MRSIPMSFVSVLVLTAVLVASLPATTAQAQTAALVVQPESRLWVEGTSNQKKNWQATASELSGQVRLGEAAGPAPALAAVEVTIPSEKLEGEASAGKFIMNRLIREALKVDAHPQITYRLTAAEPGTAANTLHTTGTLTLAGIAKEITMEVTWERLDDGRLRFTGSHTLSMPDYQIDPPSVRTLGYHVGPEVTVHFDLVVGPGS
ncbi:YceI family protein [Rhodocaloribacter litoris]|uniref:YceI family protein n=1 Tax=Rhodocaloribacter litoris TaxID=2558931 RepID=UPI001423AE1E|nr:YceI family protein [Rhodocaloribacter litoris]QXD15428.1 YceI family protein [Rhodocaloribacter litoris]